MDQNKIQKTFQYLIIVNILLIIVLSAYSSFLDNTNNKIINFMNSPIYLGAWIVLIILIFIYPLFIKRETNYYLNFFLIHLPFVLFVFIIAMTFLTSKISEISIQENEKINIRDLSKKIDLNNSYPGFLKLSKIIITNGKNKAIKSFIEISENSKTYNKIIEINKPVKIGKIKFYQKNWALGIAEIKFTFEGKEYDIFRQQNSLIESKKGDFFELIPKDIYNNKILYVWNIYNKDKKILNSGQFVSKEDLISVPPPEEYNFSIIIEDYKLISILQMTHKPFNFILGSYSIIYLIFLFFNLWGKKIFKTARI